MVGRTLAAGAFGGFLAGTASGVVLAVWGKPILFQLSGLINVANSAPAGFVVHLVTSAIVGAVFGALFRDSVTNSSAGAVFGFLFGLGVWLLGPLTPVIAVQTFWGRYLPQFVAFGVPSQFAALVHAGYGLILGASYPLFLGETEEGEQAPADLVTPLGPAPEETQAERDAPKPPGETPSSPSDAQAA